MRVRSRLCSREADIATTIHRDITVIGGSAGSIGALRALLAQLPADYPAAVLIVVHLAPESPVLLHQLFCDSALPVVTASGEAPLKRGTVVLAPPDHHLVLSNDRTIIAHGPRENRHRPSIDVLFRSAAVAYGSRVAGVILSGLLDDGAAGLWAIAQRGGACVVQDPADADFPDLPRNALERVPASRRVGAAGLAQLLDSIARGPVEARDDAVPLNLVSEVDMATGAPYRIEDLDLLGRRSAYSCPECGGALWEVGDPDERFRCHVGHAYSIKTLEFAQVERVEGALWAALRGLEENERLARRLADDAAVRGNPRSAQHHGENARSHAAHAEVLRRLIAQTVQTAAPGDASK